MKQCLCSTGLWMFILCIMVAHMRFQPTYEIQYDSNKQNQIVTTPKSLYLFHLPIEMVETVKQRPRVPIFEGYSPDQKHRPPACP